MVDDLHDRNLPPLCARPHTALGPGIEPGAVHGHAGRQDTRCRSVGRAMALLPIGPDGADDRHTIFERVPTPLAPYVPKGVST